MKNNFYIVIMAGGSGTRLWPISRANLPKQFHKLSSNEKSLLQETYDRIIDLVPRENIYISVVEDIFKITQEQLPDIPDKNFIIEPEGKNTAPAIGLVAATIFKKDPSAVVVTVASDHTIQKVEEFQKSIKTAAKFVEENPDYLLTIGIKPTEPNTGYGYIKVGRKIENEDTHNVERFVEKPDLARAKTYLRSGDYLWNASYFIWRASEMLKNFEKYQPKIYEGLREIVKAMGTKEEKEVLKKVYSTFPKEPIEPAIIEKIEHIGVIPADLGWSDVGTFDSLYEFLSQSTGETNITRGHHIGIDNKNCLIYAQDKLLATVGLDNIVIIDTPDVTLVCNKKNVDGIKELIAKLKKDGKEKYL